MAYDSATGIITAPVSVYDVQRSVGSSQTDLGRLCTATTINKWARFRPYRGSELEYSSVGFRDAMCGMDLDKHVTTIQDAINIIWEYYAEYPEDKDAPNPPQTEWRCNAPRGSSVVPREVFRLADFKNYRSTIERPWIEPSQMNSPLEFRVLYKGNRRGFCIKINKSGAYDSTYGITPDHISQIGDFDLGEKYLGVAFLRVYGTHGFYDPMLGFVATTDRDLDITTGWNDQILLFNKEGDYIFDSEGLGVLFFFLSNERVPFSSISAAVYSELKVLSIDRPFYPCRISVIEDNVVWDGRDAWFEMHDSLHNKYSDYYTLANPGDVKNGVAAAIIRPDGDTLLGYYEAVAPDDLGIKIRFDISDWNLYRAQTIKYQYTLGDGSTSWMEVTIQTNSDGTNVSVEFDQYVTETQKWSASFRAEDVRYLCITNYDRSGELAPEMGASVQVSIEDTNGDIVERLPNETSHIGNSQFGDGYVTFASKTRSSDYLMIKQSLITLPKDEYRRITICVAQ